MQRVAAMIDWHNVESKVGPTLAFSTRPRSVRLLSAIQEELAFALRIRDSTSRYRVSLRLYHGWHRARQPTSAQQEVEKHLTSAVVGRTIGITSFVPEIAFGNELACQSPRSPLFDTSRAQGQKMVDTAIACDALYMLREQAIRTVAIVSDDDDFAPVLFTAESWGLDVIILRFEKRNFSNITDTPISPRLMYWR